MSTHFENGLVILSEVVPGLDRQKARKATIKASEETILTAEELLHRCIEHCLRGGDFNLTPIGLTLHRLEKEGN